MTYSIVYSTRTGNTSALAKAAREALPEDDIIYFGTPEDRALDADMVLVGFWTDKGKANEESADFLKRIRGKKVFLFGSAGFGGEDSYYSKILSRVEKNLDGSNEIIGSFMCQGRMPVTVRERYEKMKKSIIPVPHLDSMIENFDKALSHPDENDLENLKKSIRQAAEKI